MRDFSNIVNSTYCEFENRLNASSAVGMMTALTDILRYNLLNYIEVANIT